MHWARLLIHRASAPSSVSPSAKGSEEAKVSVATVKKSRVY